jgi:hypothetical protein
VSLARTVEPDTPPTEEDWTIEAEVLDVTADPEAPPVTAAGEATTSPGYLEPIAASPLEPGVDADLSTLPFRSEATKADLASMRQAVTDRVARDLTRELCDKLVDRIEKIVWEVVPDLAEILITKEIERIRAMAENQKLS